MPTCPLREEKSLSQRAFSIYTDIRKLQDKGACGHEWQTSIKARSNGEKCPICSGARVIAGINDLQTTHPEIASEWSEKNLPLKPDEVNAKSRKNVWWRCGKCGNEWKSVINARVKGTVCPVCAEREVLAGYNDLATTDNQLLSEWDYEQNKLKPTELDYANSLKKAFQSVHIFISSDTEEDVEIIKNTFERWRDSQ